MARRLINTLALFAALTGVKAYWLMGIENFITTERLDPIVNPGKISGHVHSVLGGSNFRMTTNTESLRNSECTSVPIPQDKSNYWFPHLYFQWANGSFTSLTGGAVIYYLFDDKPGTTTAFPDDFRMLSGDPTLRTYDASSFAQQAVTFLCLDFDGTSTRHNSLPLQACPSGVRAQINFPSCWDGKNLDSADHKSHVAFLSTGPDSGTCSDPNFPVVLPRIFMEVYWASNDFDQYRPQAMNTTQPFVYAYGDRTGYGYHADFINGWDKGVLQKAVDNCHCDPFGDPTCCVNQGIFDMNKGQQCHITKAINETTTGTLSKLPGNNPVQPEGVRATTFTDPNPPALISPVYAYTGDSPTNIGKPVPPSNGPSSSVVAPPSSSSAVGSSAPPTSSSMAGGSNTSPSSAAGGSNSPSSAPAGGANTPSSSAAGGSNTPLSSPAGGSNTTPTSTPISGANASPSSPAGGSNASTSIHAGGPDSPASSPAGGSNTTPTRSPTGDSNTLPSSLPGSSKPSSSTRTGGSNSPTAPGGSATPTSVDSPKPSQSSSTDDANKPPSTPTAGSSTPTNSSVGDSKPPPSSTLGGPTSTSRTLAAISSSPASSPTGDSSPPASSQAGGSAGESSSSLEACTTSSVVASPTSPPAGASIPSPNAPPPPSSGTGSNNPPVNEEKSGSLPGSSDSSSGSSSSSSSNPDMPAPDSDASPAVVIPSPIATLAAGDGGVPAVSLPDSPSSAPPAAPTCPGGKFRHRALKAAQNSKAQNSKRSSAPLFPLRHARRSALREHSRRITNSHAHAF